MKVPESRPVRVFLVDDHEVVRIGLRTTLERAGLEVVGEAGKVSGLIDLVERIEPDVVLMDVRLPDGCGAETCRELRAVRPDIKVLFLTAFEDEQAKLATVFANADGYLLKEIGTDNLVRAIRAVAGGLSVLSPAITHPILERLRRLSSVIRDPANEQLSMQERRVLALVAEGKTNKEIAMVMGLSPKTVKNYLSHVFQKLDVTRRSEAIARVLRAATIVGQ